MLKRSITYENPDSKAVTEDFWFNFTKAEIAQLELSAEGGLEAKMKHLIATEDGREIYNTIEEILTLAVGKRSPDGRMFVKNDEIRDEFKFTGAFSALFMELLQDDTGGGAAVAEFIRGCMPSDLIAKMDAGEKLITELPEADKTEPAWVLEGRDPTKAEIMAATPQQLQQAFMKKAAHPSTDGESQ